MVVVQYDNKSIEELLSSIPDPEIPVVNILEMGMVRDILSTPDSCEVILTPTYTACPAMSMIEAEIKATLQSAGIRNVRVSYVISPPWTTDTMTDEVKEKLRQYGIAPPVSRFQQEQDHHAIHCPRCNSANTSMVSRFGATACKAMYVCADCKEPFEYFKCH